MAREYVFIDEWDVNAPQDAVFDALADATTYPSWWKPVYIEVEADGPVAPGQVSHQRFKGKLPYQLHQDSEIIRLQRPDTFEVHVLGDLEGTGIWTLTPGEAGKVSVRFDWRVKGNKRLIRVLTPLLRPMFRWNHNWAIQRAIEGLEPYARSRAGGGG